MSVLSTKLKLLLGGVGLAGAVGTGVYFGGGLKLFSSSKNQITSPTSTSTTSHSTNQASQDTGQSDDRETTRNSLQPKITCRENGEDLEFGYLDGLQINEDFQERIRKELMDSEGNCMFGDEDSEDEEE